MHRIGHDQKQENNNQGETIKGENLDVKKKIKIESNCFVKSDIRKKLKPLIEKKQKESSKF